jgi:hypothetical protein
MSKLEPTYRIFEWREIAMSENMNVNGVSVQLGISSIWLRHIGI